MSSTCDACRYSSIVDMLVPNDVWEAIADGDYCLCPNCMNDRMVARGISCEGVAQCHGAALRTHMTPELTKAVLAWRASQHEIERSGQIGNPMMAEVFA